MPDPLQQMNEGRRALVQGKFHVARRLLGEVYHRRLTQPDLLPVATGRELAQLYGQADLLASLSLRTLEEIVRHAMLIRDTEEWDRQFADYRSRSIVFDDIVRRDADGQPILGDPRDEVGAAMMRVALGDLLILRELPLEDAPRLIFGARLHSCLREKDTWVIRFEPDSGVLFTDQEVVEACFPTPLDDGVKAVLDRQRRWLGQRAGQ
jgi:hypothetical protein